jgi:succinoglycan biosynthesis transport protein ExoP
MWAGSLHDPTGAAKEVLFVAGETMIAKALPDPSPKLEIPDGPTSSEGPSRAVLVVLWRRRWVLLTTVMLTLAVAAGYLAVATPIYTSSSSVYIEQNGTKILTDTQGLMTKSDSFLYTQAEIIKSAPILSAALEKVDARQMKTFEHVDNIVAWLQLGKVFSAEVGKKDDVVTVSLDSAYPQEAAEVVNSIVDAYMTAQGARKKTTAAEMLKVLQLEKDKRYVELSDKIAAMLKFKVENGSLSFQADKSNIILERLAKLSDSLTELELDTGRIKSEYEASQAILGNPAQIRAFVEDLQTRSNNAGDKQYDDARSELLRYQTMLYTISDTNGENSRYAQNLRATVKGLDEALAEKEREIAEQRVSSLQQELKVARADEDVVRIAFQAQKKEALELNSKEAELSRLEDEAQRTEKQCGDLDNRIKEVTVNSEDSGALNIQVVQVAAVEEKPTKPRKSLVMASALLIGLLVGSGLALLWDWVDQRIRTPDEAIESLGVEMLGVVPLINHIKTQPGRGQYVHLEPRSAVAEAYRTVRTAVHFAAREDVKTILVTSPNPGDGKSTTASNLAITLAQAGLRTLLLDSDLRRPTQHKIFELSDADGVTSVILGQKKLREVIQPTPVARLDVLPCGPLPSNPSEIIAGSRFSQVIRAVMEGYDRVVIDSPPVNAVTDARILAASADATILVLRTNRSTRKGSRHALEALLSSGAQVIGIIVNAMPQQVGIYGYYGRYGGYGSYGSEYTSDRIKGVAHEPHADPAETALGQLPDDALVLSDGRSAEQEPISMS